MNIFILDYDKELCAQYHCDKHVVKMIVEYAQLLSTAHRMLDGEMQVVQYTTPAGKQRTKKVYAFKEIKGQPNRPDPREALLYKATHANHPCAIWARHSLHNYYWLASLLSNLCTEYTHRYGRIHKVESSGLLKQLERHPKTFRTPAVASMTPFPQAMPDEYKRDDTVEAYRAFYLGSKIRFCKWSNRKAPPFVADKVGDTTSFERTR